MLINVASWFIIDCELLLKGMYCQYFIYDDKRVYPRPWKGHLLQPEAAPQDCRIDPSTPRGDRYVQRSISFRGVGGVTESTKCQSALNWQREQPSELALWCYRVVRPMVHGSMLVYVGRCPTLCSMTLLAKPRLRRRVWIPADTNNKFTFLIYIHA